MSNATGVQEAGSLRVAAGPAPTAHQAPTATSPPRARSAPLSAGARRLTASRGFIALRSFAIFIAAWWLLSVWTASPIQLPSPFRVAAALWSLAVSGELFENALISTTRLAISLVVAALLAVPLGFLMGLSREADALHRPASSSCCARSPASPGSRSASSSSASATRCPCSSWSTWPSSRSSSTRSRGCAASTRSWSRPRAPWASAGGRCCARWWCRPRCRRIMVGFRLAFAGAWAAVIAAELIGAPSGLGFAIEWYRQLLMSPKVFGFIVVIGVVGYLCDLGLRACSAG